MKERAICLLIGYICGLFSTGYFVGKSQKIDIREHGSGNAGATNTLRVLGPKMGFIALAGDAFKAILAILICRHLFKTSCSEILPLITMYAGTGAVLGHNHPFYLHFQGGKGIASSCGLMIALKPVFFLINGLMFIGVVAKTRFVSLGSMTMLVAFFVEVLIYRMTGGFDMPKEAQTEMVVLAAFLCASALYRHRANIGRLKNGCENKFSFHTKEQ